MAKKQTPPNNNGNPTVIVNQITVQQLQQQKIQVDKWRKAHQAATSILSPIRFQLYEIYNEMLQDAHLYTLYDKRIRNVRRINYKYVDGANDTTQINKDLRKPWFKKAITHTLESISWGNSVFEFVKQGDKIHVNLIPRQHVRPEFGVITTQSYAAREGIQYRELPYSNFVAEVDCGLGLLNIAALNVILKRQGIVDFANFVEIFGQPIRQYEYDPMIQGAKEEVEKVAQNTGNSAALVMPKDYATLTLHNGVNASSDKLHPAFLKELRDELTTLFLGQTMTTQDGSSQAQATVHSDEQDKLIQDDAEWLVDTLNETIKPILINLGFPLQNGEFEPDYGDSTPIDKQLEMDLKLNNVIEIDAEYFYEKYKVPIPKTGAKLKSQSQDTSNNIEDPNPANVGQKKKYATKHKEACCNEHSPYGKYFS